MVPFGKRLGSDRGIVLVTSLLILALLVGVSAGTVVSVQTDLRTSANLKSAVQAFYLAEAGIEWGKRQIKETAANPPTPGSATRALSPGTFSVSFSSPTRVNNLMATVLLQSTGYMGRSSSIVHALVTKSYELTDAAIVERGNNLSVNFDGDSILVDGRDYTPLTGAPVADGMARWAISVSNEEAGVKVAGSLSAQQASHVVGRGDAVPSVGASDFLSSNEVVQMAGALCSDPGAVVQNVPSTGTLKIFGETTYGVTGSPEIHCLGGLESPGDTVDVEGDFRGVGVLVVRNARLVARGSFHWEGLIIVSGTAVGLSLEKGGDKEIFGSVILNERGLDSGTGVRLEDGTRVLYSSFALRSAAELFPASALEPIYGSIPSSIKQSYWKVLTD